MRADIAVGARSANEKSEEQQPEVSELRGFAQRGEGDGDRIGRGRRRLGRRIGAFPQTPQPDRRGLFGQHQRHDRQDDCGGGRDQKHDGPPSLMLHHPGHQRQKRQLSRRRARGQNAHRQSTVLGEPTIHDGGAERHRGRSGRAADEHAPDQQHLPSCVHSTGNRDAAREDRQRADHGAAHPKTLHGGGRKRPHETEQRKVDRQRQRDGGARPTEAAFQRHHHDAGRRADSRRHQHDQEGHTNRDPRIMKAASRPVCYRMHDATRHVTM